MPFSCPITEQRFVLETVAGIAETDVDAGLLEALLEGAARFAEGEFLPLDPIGDRVGAKWTADGVVMPEGFAAAWRSFVENGWGSLDAPEEYGGQGLPFSLATAVLEDLGAANMAFTLCPMLTFGAVEALVAHGSPEQQQVYLPKLITGEWTGTMNLTEPQAGSDVGALRATATPNGDGSFSVSGTKIFITFGDHDLTLNIVHLVLARTPDAPPGTRGITLFLVPKLRPAEDGSFSHDNDVRCASIEHKLGIHASPTCVMTFGENGDCRGWPIGEVYGGMRAMFTMMNNARLNVGLQGVQVAERATQAATEYACERAQFGPIIDHPDVRRMIMRMKALTQGARALAYAAAGQVDRARTGDAAAKARVELLTPLVKAWITDVGCEVASLGIQVHGGMGFIEETGAAQRYRDIRIAPIYEGTNGIQAADLVNRKLALANGQAVASWLEELRVDAAGQRSLELLVDTVADTLDKYRSMDWRDQLAGSYALLEMMAVATAGALLSRQARVAAERLASDGDNDILTAKVAVARYFLEVIVPEALGKVAAATIDSSLLYALDAEQIGA